MSDRGRFGQGLPVEASDWDTAMRHAIHHESVESLRHQLEVERGQRSSMERSDYFFSLGVLGLTFGLGVGVGALRPKMPRWLK